MIRINLLSSPAGAGGLAGGGADLSAEANEIKRQGFIRLVVICLFPAALYAYEYVHIPELQAQLNSKQKVLSDLTQKNEQAKAAVEEIKKFNEEKTRLQKQIEALDSLKKDRQKEVKILDSIQKDIPEKVWLTNIELRDNKIVLDGMATADQELTGFMEALAKSVFYKSVNLVRSQEQQTERGVLKNFEVSCDIDRESPSVAPAQTAPPPAGGHR